MSRLPLPRVVALCLGLLLPATIAAASPISGARQLTFEGLRAGEGYFSADGRQMVFQSERSAGNPFYQMYLMDLETGDVTRVSPGIGKTTCGWIHPDGDRVMFATTQFDPDAEAKMQAELEFRASGQTRRYSWDYDPTYELVARDLATGTYERLTDAPGYDAEGAYSPDGQRIVFASNRAAHAPDAGLNAEDAALLDRDPSYFMDIYVMDADGSDVVRLTDAPGYDGGPFWSADGRRITWRRFSEDGTRAEIFTMAADGTDQRRITDLGVMSWAPFYHPSGDYLIFATNLQGYANFELYIVDAQGLRTPVRVSDREGFDGLPVFTPDGARLSWTSTATTDGRSQIFLADWDHAAALALLASASLRAAEAGPMAGTDPDISVADLRAHVAALTAEDMAGRLTGTEGERLATAYVAAAFEDLGLAPAGADGTMFDPFPFTAGISLAEGNRLSVAVDDAAEELALNERWRPLAFSSQGPLDPAPVVFAGYGLQAPAGEGYAAIDSYDGLDVEGAWVLVWRGMPGDLDRAARTELTRYADLRYKASVAKAQGARGVIFTAPPRTGFTDRLPPISYGDSGGDSGLGVIAIDRAAGARMVAVLGGGLADLTARLEGGASGGGPLEGVRLDGAVALQVERREGRNVLARLDLDGLPEDEGLAPLMIGGHVDHLGRGETSGSLARADEAGQIHHGADDNASGIAAILEVAQTLSADAAAGRLTGARDIVFSAWSGEELGLLGASAHVRQAQKTAGTEDLSGVISAYVNLDMVGRMRDQVIVSGLGSSPVWAREIERRNAVVGLPIVAREDTYLPTDATALYLAGVPILSIFTGAHEDYHSPRDTAEKLNYEGLADIARFVSLVARSRARAEEAPEYVRLARPEGGEGRRMGNLYLGTIPDYAQEGAAGVALSGVVEGGPAAAAGLRGGDVVVGLAGEIVGTIYDYVRALNGLEPGEAVSITVERGGVRKDLEIVPATRN